MRERDIERYLVVRERDIERYLVKRVKELGGEVRKVKWVGRDGAPDRFVMVPHTADRNPLIVLPGTATHSPTFLPRARSIWVELKPPGGRATFPKNAHERKQAREHGRMRRMGQRVEVIDSFESVEEILK